MTFTPLHHWLKSLLCGEGRIRTYNSPIKRQRVYEVALLTHTLVTWNRKLIYISIIVSIRCTVKSTSIISISFVWNFAASPYILKSSTTFLFQAYESTFYKVSFTLPYFSDWTDWLYINELLWSHRDSNLRHKAFRTFLRKFHRLQTNNFLHVFRQCSTPELRNHLKHYNLLKIITIVPQVGFEPTWPMRVKGFYVPL